MGGTLKGDRVHPPERLPGAHFFSVTLIGKFVFFCFASFVLFLLLLLFRFVCFFFFVCFVCFVYRPLGKDTYCVENSNNEAPGDSVRRGTTAEPLRRGATFERNSDVVPLRTPSGQEGTAAGAHVTPSS